MIYDTFLFFNELELLELRLHELSGVVDKFVLVEATRTHSDKPKPLHFDQAKPSFKPFLDKIIHIVADDLPHSTDAFVLEDFHRDCVSRGLNQCRPDDIVLLSDADEIPKAESVAAAARAHHFAAGPGAALWHRLLKNRAIIWTFRNWFKKRHPFVKVFEQRLHLYFVNCVRDKSPPWFGTRMVHYRDFTTATDLRRWNGERIRDGGWHFSYMGGVERIQSKLAAYSHQEYNKPEFTDADRLSEALKQGRNITSPGVPLRYETINASYPAYLRQNLSRFASWVKPVG